MRAIGHYHPAPHARTIRRDILDERHEHQVGEDVLIVCVADDVGGLTRRQPRVDGVTHRARTRDAIIDFKAVIAVLGQRTHMLSGLHTKCDQRTCQLSGVILHSPVYGATDIAFDTAQHDFS